MTGLLHNFPALAKDHKKCGCASDDPCSCSDKDIFDRSIFSDDALFKLNKDDDLCDAYDKINKNFQMLAMAYIALARAIQTEKVRFGSYLPTAYIGALFFNTTDQRLYVWDDSITCYVPSYGTNSVLPVPPETDKMAEDYIPKNGIPEIEHLRNIIEGRNINEFNNFFGLMEVNFVREAPTCSVGLFIFDKKDQTMKIWSDEDNRYIPAYGCKSSSSDKNEPYPKQEGPVYQVTYEK